MFGAVGFGLAGVPTQSMAAGPLRALAAWSGLGGADGVRAGCGGMSAWAGAVSFFSTSLRGKWGKRSGVSTAIEIFEFFFPEIKCQNVIGGQKTRVFCHGLIEGALVMEFLFACGGIYIYKRLYEST